MAIASRAKKQEIIEALKNRSNKYAKPFEKGQMALVNLTTGLFGGGASYEEYAGVIMDMIAADTLLDIDHRQEQLVKLSKELLAEQRLTNRLLMRRLGLTEEDLDAEFEVARSSVEERPLVKKIGAHSLESPDVTELPGPANLMPQAISILRQQAADGDEQAAEVLRIRGLLE